jgi:dethiobiotin synthetase
MIRTSYRKQFFVTSTGTSAGKTWVTRSLTLGLNIRNHKVLAVKPIETGCTPEPADAAILAKACREPSLATVPDFYRSHLPLSPYAASLISGEPAPVLTLLANAINSLIARCEVTLVESAGGLFVPLTRSETTADLAASLGFPLIVVAPDLLGVLSHSITLYECAISRGLTIAAFVLVQHSAEKPETVSGSNQYILSERLSCPVLTFPYCSDEDEVLASAASTSGLLKVIGFENEADYEQRT